jgi:hypothetical protein
VKGLARIAAVTATLAALAVGSPAAGADTTWTKVSTDYNANIVVPSLGLIGTTAVVAWTQETGPNSADLNTVSFTTSPTQDVAGPASSKAATAWAQLAYTHALFPAPGGGLQLTFAGIHSTNTGDPLIGLFTSQRNPDGTWAAPFVVSSTSAGPSTAVLSGATPFIGGYATEGIDIFNGLVNHSPTPDQNLQPQLGGCCGDTPKMALDSAGHLWIAWYSNATGATGVYVQQLDPVTAAPIGAPALAPSSESSNNNSFGSALACAATCRIVYGNSPAAGPADAIVSWWPGQAAPTTIANLAGTGQGAGRVLTSAYRADGRLWVAWFDGKTYRATLGDATGAGGEAQDAGVPSGSPGGAYALKAMAVGDNLLLAANYAWKVSDQLPFALFVNTVAPPAPVTTAPGPRDVTLDTTPGGKGFRIQVQYTLPKACTSKTPCTLRGELRTRTGRRLYAVTPLPGDTKLVLGRRGRFSVPKAKKGKIRFFITVSKAQLLKAPFSTEGGSRVAETRLRVWYTPKGSKEALSVRDGRIKVSIARIKSGALPGLSGIL